MLFIIISIILASIIHSVSTVSLILIYNIILCINILVSNAKENSILLEALLKK